VRPNPIYVNVAGAPFKVGDRVRVTHGTDLTFDHRYQGRVGIVGYFEYQCGCGQSYPNDPMIGVRFREDIAEFWAEELTQRRGLARTTTQKRVPSSRREDE
jgi:hypothetical protein